MHSNAKRNHLLWVIASYAVVLATPAWVGPGGFPVPGFLFLVRGLLLDPLDPLLFSCFLIPICIGISVTARERTAAVLGAVACSLNIAMLAVGMKFFMDAYSEHRARVEYPYAANFAVVVPGAISICYLLYALHDLKKSETRSRWDCVRTGVALGVIGIFGCLTTQRATYPSFSGWPLVFWPDTGQFSLWLWWIDVASWIAIGVLSSSIVGMLKKNVFARVKRVA